MPDNAVPASILVVDDSRTVRAALKKSLAARYHVLEAEDGEDAWGVLGNNDAIKLVISDIMMPNLDGYGLICRMRAAGEDYIRNMPIVVITSADDAITRERAHACGADDFIVKPVEFSDLLERANFHTEANISRDAKLAQLDQQFEAEIDDAVMEAPDLITALRIIKGETSGVIDPYVVDLSLAVLPLLLYTNKINDAHIEKEILSIKKKLTEL